MTTSGKPVGRGADNGHGRHYRATTELGLTNQGSGDPSRPLADQIRALSGGSVVGLLPSGPVFGGEPARRRGGERQTFVPALSGSARLMVAGLTAAWLIALVNFWQWWLQPQHRIGWAGLAINSVLLAYLCLLPYYFVLAANRLQRVNPSRPVPDLAVAIVVTKAPSEPWTVVRTTLEAMLRQRFPHRYDVWLCDEDPTEEAVEWCRRRGVSVSTRRGDPAYRRATWPRRVRCKEGNLAFFYDHVGYARYDVVSQLDCDHVPRPTYLAEMVRPFADPAIGYVSAPSMCDSNAARSWAARGRVYREATFHGPVQLGFNAVRAPICIGSHYAVRTAALRSIGGIGPELAEDFSTTYLLNVAGWGGAFAIEAEAHGEGPESFAAMLTQEFQWARSLTAVLLGLLSRTLWRIPWKLRPRFLFALSYYVLLVFSSTVGLLLPPIAAVTGVPWVSVNYLDFLVHWFSVTVWLVLITVVLRKNGLLRPNAVPLVSWELWLYAIARWPVIAWGLLAATVQQIFSRRVEFKVTPKGNAAVQPLRARVIIPYLGISIAMSGAAITGILRTGAVGYIGLCLLASGMYWVTATAASLLHWTEAATSAKTSLRAAFPAARVPLLVCSLSAAPLVLAFVSYPGYLAREVLL